MLNEEGLVGRARGGDRDAFAALYEEYFDKVYRYILVRLGDVAEAEDVTGQVFLKALESMPSFQCRGASFAPWIFRIAHNQVVDHWRKAARRQRLPLDERMAGGELDPEAAAELTLRVEELMAAVGRLTEAQREVMALRFAADLSGAETAKVMGKSPGAVKALQHSALVALRRFLKE